MGGMSLTEADEAYTTLTASIEELTEGLKQHKERVKETFRLLPGAVLPCDTEEETKKTAWHLYWKCPQIPAKAIAEAVGLEKGYGLAAHVGPAYFNNAMCSACHEAPVRLWKESRTGEIKGSRLCESCRAAQEEQSRRKRQEAEKQEVAGCMTPEKARAMPYAEYLQTEHWKLRRKRALRLAGYKCQLCNQDGDLHTHHKTYENLGCEQDDDLVVLCKDCHAKFHDKLGLGGQDVPQHQTTH